MPRTLQPRHLDTVVQEPMTKGVPFNIVCPASRGLSLHLARTLLLRTKDPLVATARNDLDGVKAAILRDLPPTYESRVTVLCVDVTDEETIAAAATRIRALFQQTYARYVFSTAGVLHPERSPRRLEAAEIQHTLSTNLLGPLLLLKHFGRFMPTMKDNLKTPAVWAHMSARVGSIADNHSGGWYSYRASKAGLNSVTKTFDLYLQQTSLNRAICVSLHPGTVKTRLSQEFWGHVPPEQLLEPEFAAEKLVDVVMGLRQADRGLFWDWKGEKVEW